MRPPRARLAALLCAGLALAGCDRAAPLAASAGPPATDAVAPAAAAGAPGAAAARFVAGAPAQAASLPDDILRGLSTDDRVLDCDEGLVDGRSAFAPGWVLAHRVDLDADGRDDWLVEGRHRCLAGTDGADWWLYAEADAGRRLLLAAGRATAVELLPSRSHGFSDLRLLRGDGVDVHARSDGSVYVLAAAAAAE